ncbi:MAG: hypothetical protein RLZZ453_784 [Chlamydiota bacterium]|jgi:hypothetical protein
MIVFVTLEQVNKMEVFVKKKIKKHFKFYGLLGRGAFVCATGCIGFILGGVLCAVAGVFIGVFVSDFFENKILTA